MSDRGPGLALSADFGKLLRQPFRARRRHGATPNVQRLHHTVSGFSQLPSEQPAACRRGLYRGPCPCDTTHSNFSNSVGGCDTVACDSRARLAMSFTGNRIRCRNGFVCGACAQQSEKTERIDRGRPFAGGLQITLRGGPGAAGAGMNRNRAGKGNTAAAGADLPVPVTAGAESEYSCFRLCASHRNLAGRIERSAFLL